MNGTMPTVGSVNGEVLHAFTWVPNPNKYNSVIPKCQYKALLGHVLLASDRIFKYFKFFPELTKEGNIHIHGYYTIKDLVKYYKYFLPKCKQFGFVKIKCRDINQKWFDYCAKDSNMMKELFPELPVPLTSDNCKDFHWLKSKRKCIKTIMRKYPSYNIAAFFNK